MDDIIAKIIDSNMMYLLGNIIGFYLPLLCTIFVAYRYKVFSHIKKNVSIIFIFISSIIVGIYFSEHRFGTLGDYSYESLYAKNYFSVIYLLWFGIITKEYNFNISVIFCGTFLSALLADYYFVLFVKNESIFTSSIGGAGIVDGLFVYPFFSSIVVFGLRSLISVKINDTSRSFTIERNI
jgi:hypothetical protein